MGHRPACHALLVGFALLSVAGIAGAVGFVVEVPVPLGEKTAFTVRSGSAWAYVGEAEALGWETAREDAEALDGEATVLLAYREITTPETPPGQQLPDPRDAVDRAYAAVHGPFSEQRSEVQRRTARTSLEPFVAPLQWELQSGYYCDAGSECVILREKILKKLDPTTMALAQHADDLAKIIDEKLHRFPNDPLPESISLTPSPPSSAAVEPKYTVSLGGWTGPRLTELLEEPTPMEPPVVVDATLDVRPSGPALLSVNAAIPSSAEGTGAQQDRSGGAGFGSPGFVPGGAGAIALPASDAAFGSAEGVGSPGAYSTLGVDGSSEARFANGAETPLVVFAASLAMAFLLAAPLLHRLRSREAVLDSGLRGRLLAVLSEGRALTAGELGERLGIARTTVRYHLHVLETHGLVVTERHGHRLLIRAAGAARPGEAGARRLLEQDVRRDLLQILAVQPTVSIRQAGSALGLGPSSVHWHISRLAQAGLVRTSQEGKRFTYHVTSLGTGLLGSRPALAAEASSEAAAVTPATPGA